MISILRLLKCELDVLKALVDQLNLNINYEGLSRNELARAIFDMVRSPNGGLTNEERETLEICLTQLMS